MPSPSPSVKIQIIDGKVHLRCKGKTLPGDVNKLLKTKTPSNVLPLHLEQTFPPMAIIWIFNEGEGDEIEFRLAFKIFSTLTDLKKLGAPRLRQSCSYQQHAKHHLIMIVLWKVSPF